MRIYSTGSLKVSFDPKYNQDMKDVAIAFEEELKEQNAKFSIDVCGLVSSFIKQCKGNLI